MDNVRKETHAVSVTMEHLETGATRDEKDHRLLLQQKRRHRLTERNPQKVQVAKEKVLLEQEAGFRADDFFNSQCTIPSCNFWHLPVCLNHKSESGCKYGDKCRFRHVEADAQPSEKSKKSGVKGSVALLRESFRLGCVSHDSRRARGTTKIREGRGPSRGVVQKCEPHERSPCASKLAERTQDETSHQENQARAVAWDLAKNVYKLKKTDNAAWRPLQHLQRKENSWLTPKHQCTC